MFRHFRTRYTTDRDVFKEKHMGDGAHTPSIYRILYFFIILF